MADTAPGVFGPWTRGTTNGHGTPPSLRRGRAVPVRIGYTGVELPGAGTAPVVAWVECPTGGR